MVENVGCSNGIAFTLDRSGFFHTDSFARSAFWDGDHIARLRSDGGAEQRISLPTRQVSSLTFGGDDYDE
jgi:sugar lactone lactonase YvrE